MLVLCRDLSDLDGAVTHGEWASGLASLFAQYGPGAVMGAAVCGEAHGMC